MSHQTFKFQPGVCTCLLESENTETRTCDVLAISSTEAILAPESTFVRDQIVQATVHLGDFTLEFGAVVTESDQKNLVLTWNERSFAAVEKLNGILMRITQRKKNSRSEADAKSAGADPQTLARIKSKARGAKVTEVVKQDGRLDVGASLKKESKTVRAADLASRVDTVQVLNMSTIKSLIKTAVNEAVVLLGPTLNENERRLVLEQAESGFKEQVKAFQAEKAGLESKARNLEDQLSRAQVMLDDERQRVISADQFTVSDAGMEEIEKRLFRMLERASTEGELSDQVQNDMREVVTQLLDGERDKISQKAREAQNDKIELLESKIKRLAGNLEDAAIERDRAQRRAAALEASGGGAIRGNVMDAGLDDDDPAKERKLALLKELLAFNRGIRDEVATVTESTDSNSDAAPAETATPVAAAASAEAAPLNNEESAAEESVEAEEPVPIFETEEPSPEEAQEPTDGSEEEFFEDDEETHLVSDKAPTATAAGDESVEDDSDEEVCVPAPPGTEGVDPDDQLWEPPAHSCVGTGTTFKRLG